MDVAPKDMRRPINRVLHFLLLLAVASCGAPTPQPLEPTYSSIQSNVFNVHCAVSNCHQGAMPESQLNLENEAAYASLVNVRSVGVSDLYRVRPGRPDSSYLVSKLTGEGIVGDRMPLAKEPLPDSAIAIIRKWIEHGAPPG